MSKCPVCGSKGWDLVFNFYCSNQICQNFKQKCADENVYSDELKAILRSMWKMYGRGESEVEFHRRFFSEGGRIDFPPSWVGAGFAKVIKPQWLKNRIAKGL